MATELMVDVDCLLRDCDPTGEPCDACSDVPWLHAGEIVAVIDGHAGKQLVYLCQDCIEQLRDECRGNDQDIDR